MRRHALVGGPVLVVGPSPRVTRRPVGLAADGRLLVRAQFRAADRGGDRAGGDTGDLAEQASAIQAIGAEPLRDGEDDLAVRHGCEERRFRNYKKYKLLIPIVVVAICAHEITYSLGARIQALIVLLQAVCLYHYSVKKIPLKLGLTVCVALAVLFSALELVRGMAFDMESARSAVAEEGLKPALGFTSVFFSSFHLYAERAQGALPAREWPMFFSDFIALFTFSDFARWNPMDRYARNYYPQSAAAPFTLGPIADSAIWGGESDLLIRAVINGLFFAYIMRWFLRHRDRWWGVSIYVYCYSTCILTLKYTVFIDLVMIEKTMLPSLLLVQFVRMFRFSRKRRIANDGESASVLLVSHRPLRG